MKSTALIFVVSFPAVEFGTVLKTARWSALGPCRKKGGDSWTLQMMGLGPCLHISGTGHHFSLSLLSARQPNQKLGSPSGIQFILKAGADGSVIK